MADSVEKDNTDLLKDIEQHSEMGRSLRSSFQISGISSFRSLRYSLQSLRVSSFWSHDHNNVDAECATQWADIQKLPSFRRLRSSLVDEINDGKDQSEDRKRKRVVDVTELSSQERYIFIEKLIGDVEHDHLKLWKKIRKRVDKAGIKLPSVEVRYDHLCVEAVCEVVSGKPLPSLSNSLKTIVSDLTRLLGLKTQSKIGILKDVSGVLKLGRMTLLLGPPGCGKTTLLKALSGNLSKSLKVSGEISYNGHDLKSFVPQKVSAYVSQEDQHIPEMTIRETLDFSSRLQGVGSRAEILIELSRRENEAGILPDPDIDTFMKAISIEGQKTTLQTDYILKILGLEVCADRVIGDAARRGISGGQKKRLTTGEMIVGPTNALFMDEISNGLDSSTTYQIIACLQQMAHLTDATILVSLLQPAPETFDLFDDLILMGEGKIVYHGPRSEVLQFFESCGFSCPERKGVADFLQEVLSEKDQAQYWCGTEESYNLNSIDTLSHKFKQSSYGKKLNEKLSEPVLKSKGLKDVTTTSGYSLTKWAIFKACMSRELLLMERNSFIYIFKSLQIIIIASVTMTVFLRTGMDVDLIHANDYLGALSFSLFTILTDALPELTLTVANLPVFYKHRNMYLYPAWAYTISAAILKIPLSLLASTVWTCLTYYVIGYSPEIGRFFRQWILFLAIHLASISMFRFLASIFREMVISILAGSLSIFFLYQFSGFGIPISSMPKWLKWGFWITHLSYGEIGLAVNEFLSPRWNKMLPTNTTLAQETLKTHGLSFEGYFFWISLGALFGFTLLFNIGFTLALSYLNPPGSRAIISREKYSQLQKRTEPVDMTNTEEKPKKYVHGIDRESQKGLVLPFEPLAIVFQDVQYYVETSVATQGPGSKQMQLQLLHDITGALRPGLLTALMGVSGAGKTTLLDVLSGRKTCGTIEGEIKIGGYPKVQKTFARISGYCEQSDIHSPQITIEESLIFSAWLRLHPDIDSKTKYNFVKEVLETIELDGIKDALVGTPGVSGLSTEQRKRLTIAVELIANPSIIFLDEPTTGLDARAAAIVMRVVKNIANTGRTIVCTIHQPSIHIFEAFDELILLKYGGEMIYCGPLGRCSSKMIEYFEGIPGVPKIKQGYNPATWMLEVTSTSSEAKLCVDFAQIYKHSTLYDENEALVKKLSTPPPDSKALEFSNQFSQNGWAQFKICLWKQYLSYWRSPSYNLTRFAHMLVTSLVLGGLFWDQAQKIKTEQNLFDVYNSMFSAIFYCGVNNASSIFPYISTERAVLYRERFSGMYASWAYAFAQVVIEIPYIFVLAITFTVITYPMIGYYWSAYKVFWYLYTMFCSLLYFNYVGMLMVVISPSYQHVAMLQTSLYAMFNFFSGFLIPAPQIPKWWAWFQHLVPTSWSLYDMLTSQYGDINQEIEAFEETKTLKSFLRDYFGFHHDQLPFVRAILILYPFIFSVLFSICIAKLNFQKR